MGVCHLRIGHASILYGLLMACVFFKNMHYDNEVTSLLLLHMYDYTYLLLFKEVTSTKRDECA